MLTAVKLDHDKSWEVILGYGYSGQVTAGRCVPVGAPLAPFSSSSDVGEERRALKVHLSSVYVDVCESASMCGLGSSAQTG